MKKQISKNFSFKFWNIWNFIRGRKKTVITILGMICAQFAFDPELTGLIAGGAVFEGIWAILEYYFKRVQN